MMKDENLKISIIDIPTPSYEYTEIRIVTFEICKLHTISSIESCAALPNKRKL
jgi:hypothetical protein